MNVSKLESKSRNVAYTYIERDSATICVMLSGTGYTYEKPLLYYSTMQMIEADYDLVQIHYSYDSSCFKMNPLDFINIIIEDVDSVITEVFSTKKYEQVIFIGKSLGTLPIAFKYSKAAYFQDAKLILLTPLLQIEGFHESVMESQKDILMIIGTEDVYYIKESVDALRHKGNVNLIEIDGANHSLEIEPTNTKESLIVMEQVMKELNKFLIK
ncbi:MAG: alpha/beta family hydrolase [Solibacillus sp.]